MSDKAVFIVSNTSEPISVLLDKQKALEIPAVEGSAPQEFEAAIKKSFVSISTVFIELVTKNTTYKKLHDVGKLGHYFYVTEKEDKSLDVQQLKVKKAAPKESGAAASVDANDLSRFAKKSSTPVKKWATVETGKKKEVDRSKVVNAAAADDKPQVEEVMPVNETVPIYFYFGKFHYDENGETEPCNIFVNAASVCSSSQVNGKALKFDIPVPRVALEHKVSLMIEGPQGTLYNGRVNLTDKGYHFLVKRTKNSEKLEIEQAETGVTFQPIVDAEAKVQAEAAAAQEQQQQE